MKKIITVLVLLCFCVSAVFSQKKDKIKDDHEIIQQIRTSGFADILSFQNQNHGFGNMTFTQQVGNYNKSSINQQSDGSNPLPNQSSSIQFGSSNEMNVGQIGVGNVLLGFQLGYVSNELGTNKGNQYGYGLGNGNGNAFAYGHNQYTTDIFVAGERNKLAITQDGSNNGVLAIQQGSDNSISAGQKGINNYLLLLQQGSRNSISGYVQENQDNQANFDAIIQIGNDLSLYATELSKSKLNGNSFKQEGEHLSLQVNNEFANTLGGIEINQSGRDMKVVVDQSYFSLPMK